MTSEEKQEIINAVLSALATNSKTIDQLTPSTSLSDDDTFEVGGGKRVAYSVLKTLFAALWSAAIEDGISDNNAIYFSGTKLKDTALPENLLVALDTFTTKESTTPLIKLVHSRIALLDSMGSILDGQEYTPVTGDLVLRSGNYIWRRNGTGWDEDGVPLREHVLYVNKLTGKAYRLENGSLVETIIGGGEVINDLVTGGEEVALSAEMGKELSGMIEDSAVSIWIGTTDTANDTLFIRTNSNEPTIILGSLTPSVLTCKAGSSATATVSIRGRHLSSNVSVAVEGTNASLFSVSPVSFTIDADGKVTGTETVTYSPTAGTAASTQHSAALKVTSGTVTQTLALSGTVAAGPSLTLTPSTLNLGTTSGSSASGTIHLEGSALDGDVALSITGNYVTFADGTTSKTVSKSDATNGVDIEVKFTATDDTTATLTATSTGATSKTASIVGTVAELPSGYTKIKAIKGNTGTYADLGLKPNVGMKIQFEGYSPAIGNNIFEHSGGSPLFRLFLAGSNLYYDCGGDGSGKRVSVARSSISPSSQFIDGTDTRSVMHIEIGKNGSSQLYIKDLTTDEVLITNSATVPDAQFANNLLLKLDSIQMYACSLRIYDDSGVLVRDMIACKKDSDQSVGMYDRVGNTFYTSDGSSDYTGIALPTT